MCFCANFDELLDRYGIAIPFVAVFGLVDIIGVIYFIKPSKSTVLFHVWTIECTGTS